LVRQKKAAAEVSPAEDHNKMAIIEVAASEDDETGSGLVFKRRRNNVASFSHSILGNALFHFLILQSHTPQLSGKLHS